MTPPLRHGTPRYPGTAAATSTIPSSNQHPDTVPSWAANLYEDLHAHPELSNQEHRTAGIVAAHLRGLGFTTTENIGGTGILGRYTRGDGPAIAIRVELDALPLTENTGLPHSSRNDGVMHACGHDLHIAAALAAVERLISRQHWHGQIIIIGQPAEESGTGAQAMLDDGLIHHLPPPDALLAQHVTPYAPVGVMVSSPKQALAASDIFRIHISGPGGHTSTTDHGDCIQLAATLARELTGMTTSPTEAGRQTIVSVPHLVAPGHPGIRALTAELIVNLRTQQPHDRSHAIETLHQIIDRHRTSNTPRQAPPHQISVEPIVHVPAVENHTHLVRSVAAAHRARGMAHIHVPPATASDDFAVLARELGTPSAYWFVGSNPPGHALGPGAAPCHSAHYTPHPATLAVAIAAMDCALQVALKKGPQ